ncbi:hypothetical protein P8452_26219 [Trifolium repens]|nr:hypothetical protein P8452_26219 [Trifolium repens]
MHINPLISQVGWIHLHSPRHYTLRLSDFSVSFSLPIFVSMVSSSRLFIGVKTAGRSATIWSLSHQLVLVKGVSDTYKIPTCCPRLPSIWSLSYHLVAQLPACLGEGVI